MTDSKHYVERVQSTKGDTFESSVSAIIFGGESQKPPSDVISTARKPPRMGRSKPDPFVSTKRMVGALEELPPELSSERWPSKKIADAFAFRLEQKGTSVEAVTRNLQRLMVALHAGVMEGNKVVAVSAPDFQKVAAAWGIIVDRAQAREIFSMRGLPIDAPAPLHVFVRQFTNIGSEHSLLEGSRPRSLTRAPPVDYSGGAAPYAGGRENQAELTRRDLYQTVRSHRREEQEVRCSPRPRARAASSQRPRGAETSRPTPSPAHTRTLCALRPASRLALARRRGVSAVSGTTSYGTHTRCTHARSGRTRWCSCTSGSARRA